MKAFTTLTRRGQLHRLRRLAASVLPHYNLINPQVIPIAQGFNTTFAVRAEGGDAPAIRGDAYDHNRYLLRVHRPGWHGELTRTRAAVASEMAWLTALHHDVGLAVPLPFSTKESSLTSVGSDAGVPQLCVCSLLRWVKGRCCAKTPKPIYFYRVGELTAQLHNHASRWQMPTDFVRAHWDWDALFGDAITFTHLSAPEVWAIVPAPYRGVMEDASLALRQAIAELGAGKEVWGLIHADLHLDNMLFAGDEARPIDFDDCGFGYWIYDIAVALWELRLHQQWSAFRQAFLDGYARYRPVPTDQLAYLDIFIAAREATIGLGVAAATHDFPVYRQYLEEDMRHVAETIQTIRSQ